ncbi:MAG: histidine phosphatase family protein [Phycisphaerales bacterium]
MPQTMRLAIIRHAKARHESPTGIDADRALKKRGHVQSEVLGAHFEQLKSPPAIVLASPYLRARETAEHIWSALDLEPQLDDRLAADRELEDYLDVIADLVGCEHAAIIGHNPLIARLVAVLLHGPTAPTLQHETARVVSVDIQDPRDPIANATVAYSFRPEA